FAWDKTRLSSSSQASMAVSAGGDGSGMWQSERSAIASSNRFGEISRATETGPCSAVAPRAGQSERGGRSHPFCDCAKRWSGRLDLNQRPPDPQSERCLFLSPDHFNAFTPVLPLRILV